MLEQIANAAECARMVKRRRGIGSCFVGGGCGLSGLWFMAREGLAGGLLDGLASPISLAVSGLAVVLGVVFRSNAKRLERGLEK